MLSRFTNVCKINIKTHPQKKCDRKFCRIPKVHLRVGKTPSLDPAGNKLWYRSIKTSYWCYLSICLYVFQVVFPVKFWDWSSVHIFSHPRSLFLDLSLMVFSEEHKFLIHVIFSPLLLFIHPQNQYFASHVQAAMLFPRFNIWKQ